MNQHLIITLLSIVCSIPAMIFRKKISYPRSPDEIIAKNTKKRIFVFFNFAPSMALAISVIINLRVYFQSNISLAPYENYSLLIGFISLLTGLFITGYITDKYLSITDMRFRLWKKTGINAEIKDNKEQRGDFT